MSNRGTWPDDVAATSKSSGANAMQWRHHGQEKERRFRILARRDHHDSLDSAASWRQHIAFQRNRELRAACNLAVGELEDREVPIYEDRNGELVPFMRLNPGPDLYEEEIERLVWNDLEAFTAEPLFPVARQARIPGGGVPDILALDSNGRVVVIEVKRDVDRNQLAQCLEYAGWARLTNLDELAGLYDSGDAGHRGVEAFFKDWQDFTETSTPRTIQPQPRLVLIARDFQGRTRSALDFLQERHLPVTIVPVSIYRDESGRRIIDIEGDYEPLIPVGTGPTSNQLPLEGVHSVTMTDLLQAGLIIPGDAMEFMRPRLGTSYRASILADGQIQLEDGTICRTPSRAAMQAAAIASYDGWYAWRVVRLGGTKLHELRERFITVSGSLS